MALAPVRIVFPDGTVWTATAAEARKTRRSTRRNRRLVERHRQRDRRWFLRIRREA